MAPAPNRFASFVYNLLLRTSWAAPYRVVGTLWRAAWGAGLSCFSGPVVTQMHGRQVIVPYGHPYLLYSRQHPTFNGPLVELAYLTCQAKQSPISLVDVGANVGDTALLIDANCAGMVKTFWCVEADRTNFDFLQANLAHLPNKVACCALLAAGRPVSSGPERAPDAPPTTTLDALLAESDHGAIDVLKIDVEGADGEVLMGARASLQRHRPTVIFEWHPILCALAANDPGRAFETLQACGYNRFVWFNKQGEFSHFMTGYDGEAIRRLAVLCERGQITDDQHYDVVALHQSTSISCVEVAEQAFAVRRRSRH